MQKTTKIYAVHLPADISPKIKLYQAYISLKWGKNLKVSDTLASVLCDFFGPNFAIPQKKMTLHTPTDVSIDNSSPEGILSQLGSDFQSAGYVDLVRRHNPGLGEEAARRKAYRWLKKLVKGGKIQKTENGYKRAQLQ